MSDFMQRLLTALQEQSQQRKAQEKAREEHLKLEETGGICCNLDTR